MLAAAGQGPPPLVYAFSLAVGALVCLGLVGLVVTLVRGLVRSRAAHGLARGPGKGRP